LIRSADIVVVPSLEDTWGIVVDEGLQLGKAVISSDATGSGYDRIIHGQNGFIFPAGNAHSLSSLLDTLIDDSNQRVNIGRLALSSNANIRPKDNLDLLLRLVNS
jgi:glycosyltransferase involved in cell wall biosynthesis